VNRIEPQGIPTLIVKEFEAVSIKNNFHLVAI